MFLRHQNLPLFSRWSSAKINANGSNIFNIFECALFCSEIHRERLKHERSAEGNTRRSQVSLPTS